MLDSAPFFEPDSLAQFDYSLDSFAQSHNSLGTSELLAVDSSVALEDSQPVVTGSATGDLLLDDTGPFPLLAATSSSAAIAAPSELLGTAQTTLVSAVEDGTGDDLLAPTAPLTSADSAPLGSTAVDATSSGAAGVVQGESTAAAVMTVDEDSLFPVNGAVDVNPQSPVRVEFSQAIDQATLTASSFQLLTADGTPVDATIGADLTGGVVSLTPSSPLTSLASYRLEITSDLVGLDGTPVAPFSATFTTGTSDSGAGFEFTKQQVAADESRFGVTSVAIGPDGHAYASDITGTILRYVLDPETGLALNTETVFSQPGAQIVGLAFDPEATATDLRLWMSYAERQQGNFTDNFTGTIAELTLAVSGTADETLKRDVITGLPHTDGLEHQPNGIAFGPDGKLYQTVGGLTTLGGTPNWGVDETPLSGAVIVADVKHHPVFQTHEPVNVQTEGQGENNYDPLAPDAPVTLFATGLRNGYDLAWHSNGNLYSGINANSLANRFTPASSEAPAVTARPHEMLALIQEGAYYGHPNPTRDEFVLNGGNPTDDVDPWEISQYPVGTLPDSDFDPSLIYSVRTIGGNSPNGMAEYTGAGDLNGRMLVSFFSGARTIQSFEFGADGRVIDTDALTQANGDNITFSSPLDVAVHPSGAIYVANFGVNQGNPSNGALWVLKPVLSELQPGTLSFTASDYTIGEDGSAAVAIAIERTDGSNGEVSAILNLSSDTAIAAEDFDDGAITVTFAPGQTLQTVLVPVIDDALEESDEALTLTLTLPTGGATLGNNTAALTITDNDGVNVEAPPPTGGNVLFIAGSMQLNRTEKQLVERLEDLNYDVTIQDDNASQSQDADGQDLVVISETVLSGVIGDRFTTAAVPIITSEAYLFDDLGLTGQSAGIDFGVERQQVSLTITDSSHPLSAGLSGEVTLYTNPRNMTWGRPGDDAITVASLPEDDRAAVFGYDAGAALYDGSLAAARRVALPLWGNLTASGLDLFESAVLWATGLPVS